MRSLVNSPSNIIERSLVFSAKNGEFRNKEYFTKLKYKELKK
jgi:hypothetical protein